MSIQETISFKKLSELCKVHWAEATPGTMVFEKVLVGTADDVVEAHEGFFKALAAENSKVNKKTLMRAISAVSKMPQSDLHQFAGKIVHCQQVILEQVEANDIRGKAC